MKVVRICRRQRLEVLDVGDAHVHVPLLLRLLDENVAGGLCGTALDRVGPVRQCGMYSLDLSRRCNGSFSSSSLLVDGIEADGGCEGPRAICASISGHR